MTRVTVEDCRRMVSNRFELVLLAAERTRSLKVGALPLVDAGRDAPPILALREIAAGRASPAHLRDLAWRRRVLLAVPVTGSNEVAPRSVLSSDEEPELRDETDDERFEEDEASARRGGGRRDDMPPRKGSAASAAPTRGGRFAVEENLGDNLRCTGRTRPRAVFNLVRLACVDRPLAQRKGGQRWTGTESGRYRH